MAYTTLVSTDTLASHLRDPAWAIVDCRFDLANPAGFEKVYADAHIPGAVYAHLDRDLSGQKTGTNGRHPLPDPKTFAQALGRLGIDGDTQVAVYDQDTGMFAARLWWMLRWMGHEAVAVVDGGFAKWTREQRAVASGVERATPRGFAGAPRDEWPVTAEQVAASIGRSAITLVDARARERYLGLVEPLDAVAGHIPGAINYFFKDNLAADGTFLPADEIRMSASAALSGADPSRVVVYCGSGVTACHELLAFEHAGLHGARLYPGSWSEWSSDPSRPVEPAAKGGRTVDR